MSKIYTKTQREPYLVTKEVAKAIEQDHKDIKLPPNFVLTINHLEGTKIITKADIRSIDIIFNDKDYWDKKKELEPPKPYEPPDVKMTEEEREESRKAMLRVRENLIKQGIIKQ